MSAALLETPRLRLRPLSDGDVADIFTIFGDARVMRYWNTPPIPDHAEARAMIERIVAGYDGIDLLQLGIENKATKQVIGTCTLHSHHAPSRRAELGYALAASAWGKGFMHEALERFVTFAFDDWNLNRLEADIDPGNLASARTLERLGFQQEGLMPQRWIISGQFSDSACYGLLRQRWLQRHDDIEPIATQSPPCS